MLSLAAPDVKWLYFQRLLLQPRLHYQFFSQNPTAFFGSAVIHMEWTREMGCMLLSIAGHQTTTCPCFGNAGRFVLVNVFVRNGRQMMRPQIQNDFASYRRHLPLMKVEFEQGLLPQLPVADTDANSISMFIAEVRMYVVDAVITVWRLTEPRCCLRIPVLVSGGTVCMVCGA